MNMGPAGPELRIARGFTQTHEGLGAPRPAQGPRPLTLALVCPLRGQNPNAAPIAIAFSGSPLHYEAMRA